MHHCLTALLLLMTWLHLVGCETPPSAATKPADAAAAALAPPATTAELMRHVDAAAGEVRRDGRAAFERFAEVGSVWRREGSYVFVLSPDGTVLFHGHDASLIGQEVLGLTDIDGRPIVHRALAATAGPRGRGWVFYRWPAPDALTPTWKASYLMRTAGPDGEPMIVGSGVNKLPTDLMLVEQMVDTAAAQLEREGEAGLRRLRDARGPFVYGGVAVTLIDPADPDAPRELAALVERRRAGWQADGWYVRPVRVEGRTLGVAARLGR